MNEYAIGLNTNIAPLRKHIIQHPIYSALDDLGSLQIYMQYHVFAVWDFMSLLKALQNNLTCTKVPWFPMGEANTRFLINEIVVGEESDVDEEGNRISHYELYLQAMNQSGADTNAIIDFTQTLYQSGDFAKAYAVSNVPSSIREFIDYTYKVVNCKQNHVLAAVFTFGREDLIPNMFISMVAELSKRTPERISIFKYYLDRHIEVDGDHHSNLALEMTNNLCGDNKRNWVEAEQAVVQALKMRIALWDSALAEIKAYKTSLVSTY